jgi:hypothetical protein
MAKGLCRALAHGKGYQARQSLFAMCLRTAKACNARQWLSAHGKEFRHGKGSMIACTRGSTEPYLLSLSQPLAPLRARSQQPAPPPPPRKQAAGAAAASQPSRRPAQLLAVHRCAQPPATRPPCLCSLPRAQPPAPPPSSPRPPPPAHRGRRLPARRGRRPRPQLPRASLQAS